LIAKRKAFCWGVVAGGGGCAAGALAVVPVSQLVQDVDGGGGPCGRFNAAATSFDAAVLKACICSGVALLCAQLRALEKELGLIFCVAHESQSDILLNMLQESYSGSEHVVIVRKALGSRNGKRAILARKAVQAVGREFANSRSKVCTPRNLLAN